MSLQTGRQQFDEWLQSPKEGAHLEFKAAESQYDTDKLFKYCVAIANEGGGKFILGVTDVLPRMVVGTGAFSDRAETQKKILIKLGFRVDVEEALFDGKRVLIFHIPSRPTGQPYHVEGAYYMRSEDELVAMSPDRLRTIILEGAPDWLSEIAVSGVSSSDVIQLLDTQNYFDLLKIPYPSTREGVLEKFEREGLIRSVQSEWEITRLGAILFAKNLDDFDSVKRKAPRVIVYEGVGKLNTRLDRFSTKGYAVGFQALMELINSQIPSNEVIGSALRKEIKMFPEVAIRELVASALIHQDFVETGTSVAVEIYSDRVEISNPGQPFIETDRFIDEYQSRNERLADIMRRLGICEEKGSGIDRVIESSEIYQLPAPDFRVSDRRTTAVLFAHKNFTEMNGSDRVRACYQHCCLRFVMNQRMTNESLRERFKLPESKRETASRVIRDTVEAGKIKPEGEVPGKKFARYLPSWA